MLAKCMYEKHFMESEGVPAAVLNTMRTTRTCMNQFYVGFGFVKRSPYVKSANLVIQRIVESGLVDYWLSRVTEVHISPATFEQVYDLKPQRTGGPSPLSYRQFKVVMVVWTVGCALSTAVFLVECKYGGGGGGGTNDDPWWLIDPVSGRYVNVGSLKKKNRKSVARRQGRIKGRPRGGLSPGSVLFREHAVSKTSKKKKVVNFM